ncbi:uncharacterized protein CANTADRAFT_54099 [Suhomyces tanzawaensis NRRL Y-17324]|uniref:Survival protein SurE-like phosphatase/nucleotidase domain-containing protein n=1 Tax=Suhomyces tanzawaensis NRRL Y-17324 TaxID=984487 RepID=A0A1E4SDZ5_9ASCO|nr:uncharacterized protein CANTADRAFT_54099 [Suhomyces tanzawaensis NRRL Y-17324]ODV77741.1 hypothetical protein CANTADRAFT_54099 [Suhomyces tanzawaensis NRRL Y-17324]
MKLIAVLLVLIHSCAALRVLLTSTDSWVSKNVRFMYESLKQEGHDVRVVAPLYNRRHPGLVRSLGSHHNRNDPTEEVAHASEDPENPVAPQSTEIPDGGEFGHLLPVHQTYYSNIKHMNQAPRGAKGVIKHTKKSIVSNNHFGQDPLDDHIWFVNSGALDALVIGMDVILPQIGFEPELVVVGPNEGPSWTPLGSDSGGPRGHRGRGATHAMLNYCMAKNIPSIAVSTKDSHHIYYHDEKYFNIEPKQGQSFFKGNVFGKNIQFVNEKIAHVIDSVALDGATALNIIFPSFNHADSRCFTSSSTTMEFRQVEQDSVPLETVEFPQYEYSDDKLKLVKQYKHATAHNQDNKARKGSRFINQAEHDVISQCGISVNVITSELGSGVHRLVLDVESMLAAGLA